MKIVLLAVGKTSEKYLIDGFCKYQKRLSHYTQFEFQEVANIKKVKSISKFELIKMEGDLLLKHLSPSDYVILLDSKGAEFTSNSFSEKIQKWMISGKKRLVFIIGGAYGFSENLFNRGNEKISLSKMTFSHQMVRLFFVEQLYRGYTILNNEPYHHK